MTTEEGNKLIAEFMGWKYVEKSEHPYLLPLGFWNDLDGIGHKNLLYHSSWDWLHTVIDKIKDIVLIEFPYEVRLNKVDVLNLYITAPIDTVWEQVVYFIQWYNKKQKHETRY